MFFCLSVQVTSALVPYEDDNDNEVAAFEKEHVKMLIYVVWCE